MGGVARGRCSSARGPSSSADVARVSVAGATRVLGRCSSARETARETRYATRREDVMIDRGERREGAERVAFLPVVVLGSRRFQPAVLGAMLHSLGAADERARDGAREAPQLLNVDTKHNPYKQTNKVVVLVAILLLCGGDGRARRWRLVRTRAARSRKNNRRRA